MTGRGVLAGLILAAWGAGLAALAQREVSRSASDRLAETAMRVSPGADYFVLEDAGAHVGFASFTTDTVPDGLQFTEYRVREVMRGDSARRDVREVVARTSRSLVLRDVVVTAGAPVAIARVADDSTLVVVRDDGHRADTARLAFRAPLLLPALVPLAVALGPAPDVGDTHRWSVFDPVALRVREVEVRVRAESTWTVLDSASFDAGARRWRGARVDTVHAWYVAEDGAPSGVTDRVDAWVDEQGRVVAGRSPEGTRRRAAYELAFENWRSGPRGSAPGGPGAPDVAPITGIPRLADLVLRASALPLQRLDAGTPWQVLRGDTVFASSPVPTGQANGYWLPPARDFRAQHVHDLQVEPGVEVEAPLVVATARAIRGKEADPWAFARTLARWVGDSIRFDAVLTPPSAQATLRSRGGDADHHTVTFLALARAAGLPARAVRGVWRTGTSWRSHSWAEVWVGGTWLPVDPTTGDAPTDAAHVRLKVGPVGIAPELERLVSRASLEVLSSSPAPLPRP